VGEIRGPLRPNNPTKYYRLSQRGEEEDFWGRFKTKGKEHDQKKKNLSKENRIQINSGGQSEGQSKTAKEKEPGRERKKIETRDFVEAPGGGGKRADELNSQVWENRDEEGKAGQSARGKTKSWFLKRTGGNARGYHREVGESKG